MRKPVVTPAIEEKDGTLFFGGNEYKPETIRKLWLSAHDLRVAGVEEYDLNKGEYRHVELIRGSVSLKHHRDTLSILGDPDNKTRFLRFSLRPAKLDEHKTVSGGAAASAILGFAAADWEIDLDAHWWLEMYVSTATFEALIRSIRDGLLESVLFGARFSEGLYSDSPYAPLGLGTNWYLRPDKRTGRLDSPEMAFGHGATVNFAERTWIAASPLDDPEAILDNAKGPVAKTVTPSPQWDSPDLRALTRTVSRLGWAFFVLLVLFLFLKLA
jgi:hypothetical protein